jgi:hypothetical protein
VNDEERLANFAAEEARLMAEDLLPELQPYIDYGTLGAQLRHPLVYYVPLWNNGRANAQYKWKLEAQHKALMEKEWERYIFNYERPWRLQGFQEIMHLMTDTEYWRLFAQVWTDTENQWQNKSAMKRLLNSKRKNREAMMNEEEQSYMRTLPESVTIYRGCRKDLNENGMSWTLNREKAEFFANRFQHEDGKILEATVNKKEIYAVFLGRKEFEVVWYKKRKT